jgi:hypothetical protein
MNLLMMRVSIYKQLEQTHTYRNLELEVDLAVTALMTNASSLHDLFEALTQEGY